MRALIDKERLVFLHVHDSATVLSWLEWLEHYGNATIVIPLDHPSDLDTFTDFELRLLYKHTTGDDHNMFGRDKWLHLVFETALAIAPVQVNINELEVQMACVKANDEDQYRYLPGSRKPKLVEGLFTATACNAVLGSARLAEITAGQLTQYPAPVPFAATARANAGGATSTPTRTRSAPSGPAAPRGGVRQIIWDKADAMWESVGKPTDTATVLKLRKLIMDSLEADGVKRTSSSNELGNWQKARLNPELA